MSHVWTIDFTHKTKHAGKKCQKYNYQDYKVENFTISYIYKIGKPFAKNLL
jgi:hypothetical protein